VTICAYADKRVGKPAESVHVSSTCEVGYFEGFLLGFPTYKLIQKVRRRCRCASRFPTESIIELSLDDIMAIHFHFSLLDGGSVTSQTAGTLSGPSFSVLMETSRSKSSN